MTDCLPILDGMTISRILRQRRNGIRRPTGNGLASVTKCGNSSMRKFSLSELPWKRLSQSIVLTSELSKLRLQNIHRPSAGRRNGRRKMGSINGKIQRTSEVSPDLLVRILVELVANYWSWPGGGYNPTTPELVSN